MFIHRHKYFTMISFSQNLILSAYICYSRIISAVAMGMVPKPSRALTTATATTPPTKPSRSRPGRESLRSSLASLAVVLASSGPGRERSPFDSTRRRSVEAHGAPALPRGARVRPQGAHHARLAESGWFAGRPAARSVCSPVSHRGARWGRGLGPRERPRAASSPPSPRPRPAREGRSAWFERAKLSRHLGNRRFPATAQRALQAAGEARGSRLPTDESAVLAESKGERVRTLPDAASTTGRAKRGRGAQQVPEWSSARGLRRGLRRRCRRLRESPRGLRNQPHHQSRHN
jgi:hypothetical protein